MLDWPLADLLHAYRLELQDATREQYHHNETVWAILAPHADPKKKPPAPPPIPAILRDS